MPLRISLWQLIKIIFRNNRTLSFMHMSAYRFFPYTSAQGLPRRRHFLIYSPGDLFTLFLVRLRQEFLAHNPPGNRAKPLCGRQNFLISPCPHRLI